MVVGFNHNIQYKGEIYHVQTEDSGLANPQITTLLYRGGTILSSKKTSYADIVKIDDCEKVVEELMKEQHKEMLRRLKGGEFDGRIQEVFRKPEAPQQFTPQPAAPPETPGPAEQPVERRTLTAEDIFPDLFISGKS